MFQNNLSPPKDTVLGEGIAYCSTVSDRTKHFLFKVTWYYL